MLDEDLTTFYDNDVATITLNSTGTYSSINAFTSNTGTFTSVVWNVTTVDADVIITLTIALSTKYEEGTIFLLGLPISEFDSNSATVSHSISTSDPALTNSISSSKNTTHFIIKLGEISVNTSSGDSPTLTLYIRGGVKNGRAVITAAS